MIGKDGRAPFISLNALAVQSGMLEALVFVANFPIDMPSGPVIGRRAMYYKFDDNSATYVESMAPNSSPGAYFQRVTFPHVALGPHRFAYGIVDGARFQSFGQRCFTVHNLRFERISATAKGP